MNFDFGENGQAGGMARTIVVRHPQFFCGKVVQSVHTLYYVYILLLTVLGKLTPPHSLPPTWQIIKHPQGGGRMGSIICLVYGTKDTGGGLIFSMYGKWGEVYFF